MRISDWSSDVCSSDLDREHDDAGIRLDIGENLFDLPGRADQRPVMLDRLDAFELRKAGAGDAVDRLARGIGNKMQVEPVHHGRSRVNKMGLGKMVVDKMGITARWPGFRDSMPAPVDSTPDRQRVVLGKSVSVRV